jgi:hypothetical protein
MADGERTLPPARHEPQDVAFSHLSLGFVAMLALLLLSVLLGMWLYPSTLVDRRLSGTLPSYPEPQLQSNPAADLRRFKAEELSRLDSSGWVDRSQGIAHIPIDEAMRRLAEQGVADWPAKGPSQ